MSLTHQVSALAERIGRELQQRETCTDCPLCAWRRMQNNCLQNAVMGAWFFNPPALMAALPLIGLSAWTSFWLQEEA